MLLNNGPETAKSVPSRGGDRLPPNAWFLGPHESSPQMASRSVQPFFAGLRPWQVGNAHTEYICNSWPHVMLRIAMRPIIGIVELCDYARA